MFGGSSIGGVHLGGLISSAVGSASPSASPSQSPSASISPSPSISPSVSPSASPSASPSISPSPSPSISPSVSPSASPSEGINGDTCITRSPDIVTDDATVGTVAWSNPDNAKVSDDVWTTNSQGDGQGSHYLKATNFGFSIPVGATIKGILIEIEKHAAGATYSMHDVAVKIVKSDGTIGTTNKADTITNWSSSDAYVSYGSSSDLWGETWDDTKINDVDFGVVFSCTGIAVASVDHIRITVCYTMTSPSPSVSPSKSPSVSPSPSPSISPSVSPSASPSASYSPSASPSAAQPVAYDKIFNETITLTEALSSIITRNFSEIVIMSELISKAFMRVFTEASIVISDAFSKVQGYVRIFTETAITMTETFSKIRAKVFSDIISMIEHFNAWLNGINILWHKITRTVGSWTNEVKATGTWSKITKTIDIWSKTEKP